MTLNAMSHEFEVHRMVVTKKHKCAIMLNDITTDLSFVVTVKSIFEGKLVESTEFWRCKKLRNVLLSGWACTRTLYTVC